MTEQTRIPYKAKAFIAAVSRAFGISTSQIEGRQRSRPIVNARFAAFALMKKHRPDWSLTRIGSFFGGKDHTTVLSGLRQAERLMFNELFRERFLAAEHDVLSRTTVGPQAAICFVRVAEPPPAPKSLPAVKCEPPAPVPIVRHRKTRYGTEFYGGDTDSQWYAANDRRFRAAMIKAHPERAPVGMREAAE